MSIIDWLFGRKKIQKPEVLKTEGGGGKVVYVLVMKRGNKPDRPSWYIDSNSRLLLIYSVYQLSGAKRTDFEN